MKHVNSKERKKAVQIVSKRSAVIPTLQEDPPLSHKGVDLVTSSSKLAAVALLYMLQLRIAFPITSFCSYCESTKNTLFMDGKVFRWKILTKSHLGIWT